MMRTSRFAVGATMLATVLCVPSFGAEESPYETVGIGGGEFRIPKSWKRESPTSRMRASQYQVPLSKGDEDKITFIVFAGIGGSAKQNIDRWINEFATKDEKEKVETHDVDGMKITTLDISGTFNYKAFPFARTSTPKKDYRGLAAMIEIPNGQPLHFKMVGPKKSINAQLENWKRLIKTAKRG